ncbi:hypothetical protein KBX06_23055 [Micromonospora sp. C31]|uniref:hypothetical protein n=1 Tax=Micromonospora sp. C31 TaxID=2824876 RepID=UPI001B36EEB1|nr:hypothetical protein [Micromonospora sp. C31]MBQ1076013.1 hypothetical protein [Micromonospora sp. C31]
MSATQTYRHPPPAPAPAPITDVDELAEETAALLATPTRGAPLDRILDALVRLTATDGARLHATLAPVIARRHRSWGNEHRHDPSACARSWSTSSPPPQPPTSRPTAAADGRPCSPRWAAPTPPPPHRNYSPPTPGYPHHTGCSEPASPRSAHTSTTSRDTPACSPPPPTPTAPSTRSPWWSASRPSATAPPWHWDLTQALLRLPVDTDDTAAGKAAALGTPAGERLATWLRAGGLPQPLVRVTTVTRRPRRNGHDWEHDQLPAKRIMVELRPPDASADPHGLLTADPPPVAIEHSAWMNLWPSILPGHRAVVAAYTLPVVAATADMDQRDGASLLPLLADSTGPGGAALDLALAYGLGARHGTDRVAALDALLALAAAGQLDATATGHHLGQLVAEQLVKLSRALEPLRDAALAGAPLTVWRLIAAALPALLAAPRTPRGLPDLLSLAAETATTTGVHTDVPGLADVAARSASSRLVTEARRLHRALHPA